MSKYKDPRIVKARFPAVCFETGKEIKVNQMMIYYPATQKAFCMDSEQATEFKKWQQDNNLGHEI